MKTLLKQTFFYALVLSLVVGSFSSCSSDDDDDKPSAGVAAKVAGTYEGTLTTTGYEGAASVKVVAASSNEVTITITGGGSIAPFKVQLVDSGVKGIIQSEGFPSCAFYTQTNKTIMNNLTPIFTFEGTKK